MFSANFPTSSKYLISIIQFSTQSFFVRVVIIFGFKAGNTEENLAKNFCHPEEDVGQELGLSIFPLELILKQSAWTKTEKTLL